MRILTVNFLSRFGLVSALGLLIACGYGPSSNQTHTTSAPELPISRSPMAEATPRPFDPKLDIGVVTVGSECSELLIRNQGLRPGDELQVVATDDTQDKLFLATVVGPKRCSLSPQSAIKEIVIIEDGSPPAEYEIRFPDSDDAQPGFAVVSGKASVVVKNGAASLTASNVKPYLSFRECGGNESHHMTVWEGKPLVGKRVWHSYISLAYDTVPTCKDADFE